MNSDLPTPFPDELETRITALLLGELNAAEAADVRRAIEASAELTALHDQLARTIGLVREAVARPTAGELRPAARPQLSEERRIRLLERLRTPAPTPVGASAPASHPIPAPSEPQRPRRWVIPWYMPMSLAAALVVLLTLNQFNESWRPRSKLVTPLPSSGESVAKWDRGRTESLGERPSPEGASRTLGAQGGSSPTVRTVTATSPRRGGLVPTEGKKVAPREQELKERLGVGARAAAEPELRAKERSSDPLLARRYGLYRPGFPGYSGVTPATDTLAASAQAPAVASPNQPYFDVATAVGGPGDASGKPATYGLAVTQPSRAAGIPEPSQVLAFSLDQKGMAGGVAGAGFGGGGGVANNLPVQGLNTERTAGARSVGFATRDSAAERAESLGRVAEPQKQTLDETAAAEVEVSTGQFVLDSNARAFKETAAAEVEVARAPAAALGVALAKSQPAAPSQSQSVASATNAGDAIPADRPTPPPASLADPVQDSRFFQQAPERSQSVDFYSFGAGAMAPGLGAEGISAGALGKVNSASAGSDSLGRGSVKLEVAPAVDEARKDAGLSERLMERETVLYSQVEPPAAAAKAKVTSAGAASVVPVAGDATLLKRKLAESEVALRDEALAAPAIQQQVVDKGMDSRGAKAGKEIRELATRPAAQSDSAPAPQLTGRFAGRGLATNAVAEKAGVESKLALAPAEPAPAKSLEDFATPAPRTPPPVPQPEVATRDNAFSTFSLNVTDVSFKLAVASLEKGAMPDPATIRTEEFINAFHYHDPEPARGAPIGFTWERAQYPFAHNRELLRFAVRTAASGRESSRPLNLVLLLDNSGSMERADRVRIVREALRVLSGQLQPQDRISVVTFARTARLWVDALAGNQAGDLADRIGSLAPEGGTNLEEAMKLAYATASRHFLGQGVNRVVLLTDGAANLGDVDPGSLKRMVESWRQRGVALDCFGIGWEGLNDELLETLARNGDGRYGFVNTPEEASDGFATQLAGALHVAAADVKVQVEFNPQRVSAWRQIGYAKHQLAKEQFRDNTVDAAELTAAESGNALYAVQVDPNGAGPLATVRVRFREPTTGVYREHAWDVPYTGAAAALDRAPARMRLAATASAFSEWLAGSPFAAEVTPDRLLNLLQGVPAELGPDPAPQKLEWMIRQARSISGK